MGVFASLLVGVGAAFAMFRVVREYNAKLAKEAGEEVALVRSMDPGLIAMGTAALAIFTVPYAFYRMRGAGGIPIGLAVVLGMGICNVMVQGVLMGLLYAFDPPSAAFPPVH